jgi:hypothetical protein
MVNYVISMQNYMKISVLQNNCTILLVFAPFATTFGDLRSLSSMPVGGVLAVVAIVATS